MSKLLTTFQERFGDWLTALGQHLQLSLLTLLVAIFLTINPQKDKGAQSTSSNKSG